MEPIRYLGEEVAARNQAHKAPNSALVLELFTIARANFDYVLDALLQPNVEHIEPLMPDDDAERQRRFFEQDRRARETPRLRYAAYHLL